MNARALYKNAYRMIRRDINRYYGAKSQLAFIVSIGMYSKSDRRAFLAAETSYNNRLAIDRLGTMFTSPEKILNRREQLKQFYGAPHFTVAMDYGKWLVKEEL